jgi:hypothetical protein
VSRRVWAPVAASAAGGAVALLGAAQQGAEPGLGALLGTGVVVAFLGAGLVPLLVPPAAGAGPGCMVLGLTYLLRLAAAGAVLAAAARSGVVDLRWTAYAVVAAALAWTAAQGVAVLGPGGPVLPPGLRPAPGPDDQGGQSRRGRA